MTPPVIAAWHEVVRTHDASRIGPLLADDVVFHSPVVHTPQVGPAITERYLAAALGVLSGPNFAYVREVYGEHDAVLEFTVEVDGIVINGVDLIRWNDANLITDFKVMVRPLKAVTLLHQKMAAQLTAR